ncbi:ras-related protein Rab-17 isoform X2 [Phyllostomus hastatus]|uniref:ras-related protein Rab-17 isoform X2 n=1 Tax=Phyllostomus hastatus TaxID=9423 RepID=UPI001E6839A9|nr:ras-related protein Rab-17 isoform X2 [Phyllostomus hastatus]
MAQAAGALRPGAGPPHVFKLVLLGSGSVGKSSLAMRYVKDDFRSILPTVGCAFFTKVVELGAASAKLEIWDTAGQEKYHSVCHLYFRGANAALLVYDITSKRRNRPHVLPCVPVFPVPGVLPQGSAVAGRPGEGVLPGGGRGDAGGQQDGPGRGAGGGAGGRQGVCREPALAVHGDLGQSQPPGD